MVKGVPENEKCVELELVKIQAQLLVFICRLTGGIAESEDILQRVNVKLWKQRHDYDRSKPFANWARTVARYEVMAHRSTLSRDKLVFSDEIIEMLAERLSAPEDKTNTRLVFLEKCRNEMRGTMRQIVDWFYFDDLSCRDIAKRLGRSAGSVANSLYHARNVLRMCVEGKLKAAGGTA